MNTLFEIASYWVNAGIAVIPIQHHDKRPDASMLPKDNNGNPTWEPYKTTLPTNTELQRWFMSNLENIGIVTGWRNLVVIDFDDLGAYFKWSVWATKTGGITRRAAEMTYMVETNRGVHVYFRSSQKEHNRKLQDIDIKGNNGYVLAPPSIHPSGKQYRVLQSGVPVAIEALSEVLPADLLIKADLPKTVNSPAQGKSLILSTDDPWQALKQGPDPNHDLVNQVRATFKIEDFFPGATNKGRWSMAPCPFHDDKNPSFWIDTQRQICGCFSGCTSKPLDVINLFARLHGLTNRDAILTMAKLL